MCTELTVGVAGTTDCELSDHSRTESSSRMSNLLEECEDNGICKYLLFPENPTHGAASEYGLVDFKIGALRESTFSEV